MAICHAIILYPYIIAPVCGGLKKWIWRTENAWRFIDILIEETSSERCFTTWKVNSLHALKHIVHDIAVLSQSIEVRSRLEVCQPAMKRSIQGVRQTERIRNSILRTQRYTLPAKNQSSTIRIGPATSSARPLISQTHYWMVRAKLV